MKKVWYAPNRFESYGEEEIKAVEETLRSGWLGGQGPKSVEFEEAIAKRFGKKHGFPFAMNQSLKRHTLSAL